MGVRVWVHVQFVVAVEPSLSLETRRVVQLREAGALLALLRLGNEGDGLGSASIVSIVCCRVNNSANAMDLPKQLSVNEQELLHGLFAATLL